MISGNISVLESYLPDSIKEKVMSYIKSINKNSEEGFTQLYGEKVYGRVMEYSLKERSLCNIEAHNKYVDIQITIDGIEGIEIYDRKNMLEKVEYDEKNDVVFFEQNDNALFAQIKNYPGYFSMFFPEDAHAPMISTEKLSQNVKKYVIKIDKSLFL